MPKRRKSIKKKSSLGFPPEQHKKREQDFVSDARRFLRDVEDEADAAFLYRVLAEAEPDPDRKKVFAALAAVEDRHVEKLKIPQGLLTERQTLILKCLYDEERDVTEVAGFLGAAGGHGLRVEEQHHGPVGQE
jgi:DNA-directed RNA polymerase specialized sigma subunit